MRILITGANGFVGSHVAERLQAESSVELRLMLRRNSNTRFLANVSGYERIDGDVRDVDSLRAAVDGVDIVIHVAGVTVARTTGEYEAANGMGTANLVLAAVRANVPRFVYVSSLAAIGPSPDGRPQPLDTTPHPVTAYGGSKLIGERALRAQAGRIEYVILRPPALYGPRDSGFLPMFRGANLGFFPLLGDGQNLASFCYVTDTAEAIVAATLGKTPPGAVYSFEDGRIDTWSELVDVFSEASGRRVKVLHTPMAFYRAAGYAGGFVSAVTRKTLPISPERVRHLGQRYWVCDSEAIQRDLGWSAKVGIAEGMRLTLDWYHAEGWL